MYISEDKYTPKQEMPVQILIYYAEPTKKLEVEQLVYSFILTKY